MNDSRKGTTRSLEVKHMEDKFYTVPHIAEELISDVDKLLSFSSFDVIIEPSAGSGSFSSILDSNFDNIQSFDINPEHESIEQADWLKIDKNIFQDFEKKIVIGNPPFGYKGGLAMEFIQASSFADVIAFVLPKGFKKDSVKNRIPLNFHLILEKDTPKNSFLLDGQKYDVPCVFQIWEKREELREVKKKKLHTEFVSFVDKADADFMLIRVGGNAGKATLEKNGSPATNLFLKNTSSLSTKDLIDVINDLEYPSKYDTTGPRSVPKSEFIEQLEKALFDK